MKLLDLYYTIWVDLIIKMKSIPANKDDWKYKCMVFMSMAMATQYGVFIALFERHITHSNLYKLNINIFPGKNLNAFVDGFILFLLPFLLMNYFFIFWRDRYKILLTKYKYNEGNYALIYVFGTFILGAIFGLFLLLYKVFIE